tara:strand:+ start:3747 stop:4145 length:399 start_codon:yes stop_codon:yes gene_type:complete
MEDNKIKSHQSHRLGTWAELTAAAFLTRRKFEVFLHLGQQSLCDLIAYQRRGIAGPPIILLIDVKTVNLETKSGPRPLSAEQKAAKVVRMIVGTDGAVVCEFDLYEKGNRGVERINKTRAKLSSTKDPAKDN